MYIEQTELRDGNVTLGSNDMLIARRVLLPDERPVPLYDNFDAPLWLGITHLAPNEIAQLTVQREEQINGAMDLLMGEGVQMISSVQKLMKHDFEVMLFYTDSDILNPGNSLVVMNFTRASRFPDPPLKKWEAFPLERRLSDMVGFRPRAWHDGTPLPGYVPARNGRYCVLEVTGFQKGRAGLPRKADSKAYIKDLTYPVFHEVKAEKSQAVIYPAD